MSNEFIIKSPLRFCPIPFWVYKLNLNHYLFLRGKGRRSPMTQKDKKIYAREIGIGCDLVACGKTDEEVITKVGNHVLAMHGIEGFSKEFYHKAQSAIREGNCDDLDSGEVALDDCSACDESYIERGYGCCC
jgi:predicted small metal-binding protein